VLVVLGPVPLVELYMLDQYIEGNMCYFWNNFIRNTNVGIAFKRFHVLGDAVIQTQRRPVNLTIHRI
jgi:hypothetical protein